VLVADDEQAIQQLLTRVIGRLGLMALCVGDGAAAIAAVEAHHDKLICAIMDIVMPGVNGVDAAHAIQVTAPNLPIVLMSGAIPETHVDRIAQLQLAGMLSKPFAVAPVEDLLRHVAGNDIARGKDRTYASNP
jgi:two-component system OmpR family response regulator